jgi:hypothetical protein
MKNKIKVEEISSDIIEKYKNKTNDIKDINAKFVDSFSSVVNNNINNTENKSTNAVIKDHHPIDSRSLDDLIVIANNGSKLVYNDNSISPIEEKSIEDIILDYIYEDNGYENFKNIIKTEYEYKKMHNIDINSNLEKLYNDLERK